MPTLGEMLTQKPYLLADGATGTGLFEMGLQTGDSPELWNIEHPDRVEKLHQEFIKAGSDIILTNSFGGNFQRLKLHGLHDQASELNIAAAKIARQATDNTDQIVLVAGSMGPTGDLFQPLGTLSMADATAVFTDQAQALAQGGVDLLWIETLSSKEEVIAALAGASTTNLPIVCTLSFDTNGSTMMGLSPQSFSEMSRSMTVKPHAFGANCGLGPAETVCGILNLASAAKDGDILVAKGNCGIPEYQDGLISYAGTPELMAQYACLAFDAGAKIIGGCCGTTSSHIAAMSEALSTHVKRKKPKSETVIKHLGEVSPGTRALLEGKMHAGTIAVSRRKNKLRRRSGSK